MAFQVRFSPRAVSDIAVAVSWMARNSPEAAARWRIGLFQVIENLETDPNRYPAADESMDLGIDLRELLYGRRRGVYRILFTINEETVNVLRVRHAAQDRLSPDDI
jgi:plasmid stabilization system protein ParE